MPDKEDEKRLIGMLEEFQVPLPYANSPENKIYGAIEGEIDGYFEGEVPLEKVLHNIYNGIDLIQKENG